MNRRLHLLVILSLSPPQLATQQKPNRFLQITGRGALNQGAEQNYETAHRSVAIANTRQAHVTVTISPTSDLHASTAETSSRSHIITDNPTQNDDVKTWKNSTDFSATITDDTIERMITSENADTCRKLLAQEYTTPYLMNESAWHDTPIQGTSWTIRDVPVVELQCGGACNAPDWICGHWVYRAWYVGDGEYHNYDIMDPQSEASPLGIPSPREQRLIWHQMVHAPDESITLLSAAAFVPTAWSTDWLMLGLGSGGKANFFHWATPWGLDAVEIDEHALDVAQKYFRFPQLPLKSSKDRQCLEDQRMCVTIADASAYVDMLAAAGRQYGVVFVDIGSVFFHWDPGKQARLMKAIAAVSPVVVMNPFYASFADAFQIVHNEFGNAFCLPLPNDDYRKCFVLGLSRHALSNKDAHARATRIDAQIGWHPFSLATYLREHPVKPGLPSVS